MENQEEITKIVEKNTVVIVKNNKSVGVSLLLTFLFRPFGMLYSTVLGAILMVIISAIVAFFTLGFGLLVTWPICMIWGALAVIIHNNKSVKIKDK